MQNKKFEILVQTALTVGLFWTILKLTPKSALLSFTILYSAPTVHIYIKSYTVARSIKNMKFHNLPNTNSI